MDPIVTPLAALFGLLFLADATKKPDEAQAEGEEQPEAAAAEPTPIFDAEARQVLLAEGGAHQVFRPNLRAIILGALGRESVSAIALAPEERGKLFQLTAGESDLNVAGLVAVAEKHGLTVLGSLTLTLTDTRAPQYILLVPAGDEDKLAFKGGAFAVLSAPKVVTPPVAVSAPPVVSTALAKTVTAPLPSPSPAEAADAEAPKAPKKKRGPKVKKAPIAAAPEPKLDHGATLNGAPKHAPEGAEKVTPHAAEV